MALNNQKRDFDPEKLVVFFEGKFIVNERTECIARVYSYDGGEKRIKILSEQSRRDGTKRILKQCPSFSNPEHISQLTQLLTDCSNYL